MDLTKDLPEGASEDPLLRLIAGSKPTLRDFLDAVEAAGDDPRVKVLLARLGDDELGLAKIQEIRDAITAFRGKGKLAIAFADSFGEFGPGTRPYYLATAFDEIWLQPIGNVGLTGLYAESPFVKGTLDLLGVVPEFDHREQYKTAMNLLTETKMTPAHREEVEALLSSVAGQIVRGISQRRKLSRERGAAGDRPRAVARRGGGAGKTGRPSRLPRRDRSRMPGRAQGPAPS